MHAFRKYVQDELDRRGWKPSDLASQSGVSKQVLSNLLTDTRDRLRMMPSEETVSGIAKAFGVDEVVVLRFIGSAMGLPVSEPVIVYDASRVPNDELLRVLAARLGEAGEGDAKQPAPMNPGPDGPSLDNVSPIRPEGPYPPADDEMRRRLLGEAARPSRGNPPANPPDGTTGEESQDDGQSSPE